MTAPTCPLDGKPIHDHASICGACTSDLTKALAELPGLLDDLELTLSRQTAQGQRHGGRSSEKALPYDVRASDTLDAARVVLVGWVNVLIEDSCTSSASSLATAGTTPTPVIDGGGAPDATDAPEGATTWKPARTADRSPSNTPQSMARWLFARLDRARRHEAGAEIAVEIRDLSATIRRASDRRGIERVYAGLCGAVPVGGSQECPNPLYARVTAETVTCTVCGARHDVAERREQMRAAVADLVLPAPEAANAVTALWGKRDREDDDTFTWRRITASAVRNMAHRGAIVAHAHDTRTGRNVPLYRVGDILTKLVEREAAA